MDLPAYLLLPTNSMVHHTEPNEQIMVMDIAGAYLFVSLSRSE